MATRSISTRPVSGEAPAPSRCVGSPRARRGPERYCRSTWNDGRGILRPPGDVGRYGSALHPALATTGRTRSCQADSPEGIRNAAISRVQIGGRHGSGDTRAETRLLLSVSQSLLTVVEHPY